MRRALGWPKSQTTFQIRWTKKSAEWSESGSVVDNNSWYHIHVIMNHLTRQYETAERRWFNLKRREELKVWQTCTSGQAVIDRRSVYRCRVTSIITFLDDFFARWRGLYLVRTKQFTTPPGSRGAPTMRKNRAESLFMYHTLRVRVDDVRILFLHLIARIQIIVVYTRLICSRFI